MIPRRLHQVWIGPKEPPWKWMETWRRHHPGWQYTLWDNDLVFGRRWKNQRLVDFYRDKQKWHGVADIIRYEILHDVGGFMPGADSECLRNVDELLKDLSYDAYAVYENETVRPGLVTPLYASSEGNDFAKILVDGLRAKDKLGEPWQTTGNVYMRDTIAHYPYARLQVWPSHYFNPFHYTGTSYVGDGPIYAVQKWGTTAEEQKSAAAEGELAKRELQAVVPDGAKFILVDDQLLSPLFDEFGFIPFLEKDGVYWGPPADAGAAVCELQRIRSRGAEYIVFAWPAFWWLEYYAELDQHLRCSFDCVLNTQRLVVFDLKHRPFPLNRLA